MDERDFHAEFLRDMLGDFLRRINRTVLPSGTSEGNHQMREITVNISFHVIIRQFIYRVEIRQYLPVFFQKANHRFIEPGNIIESFEFSRVVNSPAIEYIAPAVSRRVVRNSFFKSKTHHAHFQHPCLRIGELLEAGHFLQYLHQIRIFVETVFQQLPEIIQSKRDALDEVRLFLEISPETISAQYL